MSQDRPTARELLDAVADFLERELLPTLDGRLAFHTRVAVNALGIVGREIDHSEAVNREELIRIAGLLSIDAPVCETSSELRETLVTLERELASKIRDKSLEVTPEVFSAVLATVEAKLRIANPEYAS